MPSHHLALVSYFSGTRAAHTWPPRSLAFPTPWAFAHEVIASYHGFPKSLTKNSCQYISYPCMHSPQLGLPYNIALHSKSQVEAVLHSNLRSHVASLLPHSVSQGSYKDPPYFKGRKQRPPLLNGEMSHCKTSLWNGKYIYMVSLKILSAQSP